MGEILNLIESVSGGFPSYFFRNVRNFSVAISVSLHVFFFILVSIFDFYVFKIMHL